jgi:hypothetical protein
MRHLPLYLKLQQLVDGELPEEQYREMTDLEREFRELDEIDQQKDEASDEDLELDEIEEDLIATTVDEETDLSGLIDRKNELEAQLFGDEDAPWNDGGKEIQPLRELVENLSGMAGVGGWGGFARPRFQRLLRAIEELDPGQDTAREGGAWKTRKPGARNIVAARRRQLLAEFRDAWKEAVRHGPVAEPAGPEAAEATPEASQPAGGVKSDPAPSSGPVDSSQPPGGGESTGREFKE